MTRGLSVRITCALFVIAATALASCGGGGGGGSTRVSNPSSESVPALKETPSPTPLNPNEALNTYAKSPGLAPPVTAPPGAPTDDWVTFAHDNVRSGFQPQSTGITKQNVNSLKLRWQYSLGQEVSASPIVSGGLVYIAAWDGSVNALSTTSGALVWKQTGLGHQLILMTPTLADGKLFIGTHTQPGGSLFAALDAETGAILWTVPIKGCIRGEPVVANGVVYEGEACGDAFGSPPACIDGGMRAYDEQTGNLLWSLNTTSVPNNGGGQWSPVSFDGKRLYYGNGNVCSVSEPLSNSEVSIALNGSQIWTLPSGAALSDDDIGGGTLIDNGQAFVDGKNGIMYDINSQSGQLIWSKQINIFDGFGPIGTPSTDGTVIISTTGFSSVPSSSVSPGSLIAVNGNGDTVWHIITDDTVRGYAALNGGMAFVDFGSKLNVLDETNGSVLWSYTAPAQILASPAVVPSGVYTVDTLGNVYAFSSPSSTATTAKLINATKKV